MILIDEIGSLHKEVLNAINKLLQDLHTNTLPMGGVLTVFGGDFRQILVVMTVKSQP